MDMETHSFTSFENTYKDFLAPAFEVSVGGKKLESNKVHFSSLSVDIDAGKEAGGCSFTIESQYDYEKHSWDNDLLNSIKVGAKIEIKAGYVTQKDVFFGYVDDFSINYEANSAPTITVNGMDAKGYLMNAKDRKYMSQKSTASIVKEILNECVSNGYAKSVTVGTIQDFDVELIQDGSNDYQFLCYLAEAYNMNFFVVNGEIVFDKMMSKTDELTELKLGVSLLSFTKSMSLRDQVGKVIVYGIDPKTLKPISGEATKTTASGEGKDSGGHAVGFDGIVEKEVSMFVQTPDECKALAQARFDQRAYSFVSGKGRCIGIPDIIPGRYIKLGGFDDKSSDKYFISRVTHEYNADGYYTTFQVKGAKSK